MPARADSVSELGLKLEWSDFVTTEIFNSNRSIRDLQVVREAAGTGLAAAYLAAASLTAPGCTR